MENKFNKPWRVLGSRTLFKKLDESWITSVSTALCVFAIQIVVENPGINITCFLEKMKKQICDSKINHTYDSATKAHYYKQLIQFRFLEINSNNELFPSKECVEIYNLIKEGSYTEANLHILYLLFDFSYGSSAYSEIKFLPENEIYPFRIIFYLLLQKPIPFEYMKIIIPYISDYEELTYVNECLIKDIPFEDVDLKFKNVKNNAAKKFNMWLIPFLLNNDYVFIKDGYYKITDRMLRIIHNDNVIKRKKNNTIIVSILKLINGENKFLEFFTSDLTRVLPGKSNDLILLLVLENYITNRKIEFTSFTLTKIYDDFTSQYPLDTEVCKIRDFSKMLTSNCGLDSQKSEIQSKKFKNLYVKLERGMYVLNFDSLLRLEKILINYGYHKYIEIFYSLKLETIKKLKELNYNLLKNDKNNPNRLNNLIKKEVEEARANEKKLVKSLQHERDPKNTATLREYLNKIGNNCEYCNDELFTKENGDVYFESHHICPLSEGGKDTLDNMIAVCANCHRKAHHSVDKETIKSEMEEIANNRFIS